MATFVTFRREIPHHWDHRSVFPRRYPSYQSWPEGWKLWSWIYMIYIYIHVLYLNIIYIYIYYIYIIYIIYILYIYIYMMIKHMMINLWSIYLYFMFFSVIFLFLIGILGGLKQHSGRFSVCPLHMFALCEGKVLRHWPDQPTELCGNLW